MTPEQLHDALGMLPADLIAEADRLRSRPIRKVIYWRSFAAAAACFLLVLGCGLFVLDRGGMKGAVTEDLAMAAPQAPAMAEPESAKYESANSVFDDFTDNAPEEGIPEPEEAPHDLMEDVAAGEGEVLDVSNDTAMADFAVNLFQNTAKTNENTLLSPLSVMSALAMAANGADGETLAQMEAVMGMDVSELTSTLDNYLSRQTDQLKLANSIWFNESGILQVKEEFLQTNANHFRADLFEAPMNDRTLKAINNWVKEKTDGMIPEILDEIPMDAMMYLVNALAFEAEWPEVYLETSVQEATFTREDGTEQSIQLMHSSEYQYIEDELAAGFIKPYKGGDYAFVALLPKEGVTVSEYVASLSGEHLLEMLRNPVDTKVFAAIPKFESEYSIDMAEVLKEMGMTDAFDPYRADFSGIGSCEAGNLCIGRVLHKTAITVAEQGTKAGAATVVEMRAGSAFIPDPKEVTLDRPFVYMLIDCRENIPFFIGTMMNMET